MDSQKLYKNFKRNIFKVPDNYFETFETRVLIQLHHKENKWKVWQNIKKLSIAAVFFIATGIGLFLFNRNDGRQIDLASTYIDKVELVNFQNDNELNDDELIELINNQALDSIYHLEVIKVSKVTILDIELEEIENEYSPLDDELNI